MKALSIKQPWAWLIVHGFKDIENRTWRIGRNPQHGPHKTQAADFGLMLPTRIYVHAGKVVDWAGQHEIDRCYKSLELDNSLCSQVCHLCFEWKESAIIGEVDIRDCVEESASRWFVGPYGFTLANPIAYAKPVPYRGQLGFFDVPDSVMEVEQNER